MLHHSDRHMVSLACLIKEKSIPAYDAHVGRAPTCAKMAGQVLSPPEAPPAIGACVGLSGSTHLSTIGGIVFSAMVWRQNWSLG